MRRFVPVFAALLVATPATARERAPIDEQAARAARVLSSPVAQEGIAALVGAFADAVLDTHVGPLARYADPRDHVRADDTLGDLVRRDDPAFDRKLHDRTRDAVAGAGRAATDVVALSAELRRTSDRLRKLLDATGSVVEATTDVER